MNRIYYVNIKGRTLESRNLRELLARAVSEKRSLDRMSNLQARSRTGAPVTAASRSYREVHQAAVL